MDGDSLNRGGDTQYQPVNTPENKQKKSVLRRVVKLVKKQWMIVLALLLIVGGLLAWVMYQQSREQIWKQTTDSYSRADYAKAAGLLKNVGMPSEKERLRVYAQTMLATRDLEKAEPAYKKLFEATKEPADKLVLGNIYNEQKKYDDAVKVYQDVIATNKNNIQAYVNLTIVYKMQGKQKEAINVAKEAVSNNPENVTVHELLVSMLMDNKESQEYKDAVAKLKSLNPEDTLLQTLNNKQ